MLRGMGELGFETKRRAEQALNPAESTAHERAGALGSALPEGKAGHKPDDTPVTARPGFLPAVQDLLLAHHRLESSMPFSE